MTPPAHVRPGRNARWHVEWRVPRDPRGERLDVVCREVRGATAARSLALGVGQRAVAGEFRLSAPGVAPVIVDLERLRSWSPGDGPPEACPRALWSLELASAAAVDDLRHDVRAAADKAIAAEVLSASDAAGLVRLALALTTGGRHAPR